MEIIIILRARTITLEVNERKKKWGGENKIGVINVKRKNKW